MEGRLLRGAGNLSDSSLLCFCTLKVGVVHLDTNCFQRAPEATPEAMISLLSTAEQGLHLRQPAHLVGPATSLQIHSIGSF